MPIYSRVILESIESTWCVWVISAVQWGMLQVRKGPWPCRVTQSYFYYWFQDAQENRSPVHIERVWSSSGSSSRLRKLNNGCHSISLAGAGASAGDPDGRGSCLSHPDNASLYHFVFHRDDNALKTLPPTTQDHHYSFCLIV